MAVKTRFANRITEMLGVEYPIIQAPMGWIARAQLASPVSNAGGMGMILENARSSQRQRPTRFF